ncbi:MAG: MATE family efflux transporter [Firmicutes bacterium HGW-Firmicutes-1]|jgi:putative MATE family efflux protein|nr:MAG: MATE family efflux transporter [Firmicutes bacterium HGW-Firmicutes-1]
MEEKNDRHFYKTLVSIAIPIAVQSLITNLLNLIDVFMISSLDTSSIGGVSIANKIFFLLNLFLFGTNSGAAILSSQYFGNKDFLSIRKVLGISLILGIGGSFFISLGAILIPETIITAFAPYEPEMINEGGKYLRIIGFSYMFTAITFSYSFLLRTTHNAKLPMVITAGAILINTFFNWVLIFGKLGAPALGVEGAAIATVVARIVECILLIYFVYKYHLPLAGKLSEIFRFSSAFFRHYIGAVGFVILNEIIWSLGVTGYSFVYGRMGEVVTASMAITQPIEQLSFVVFFGLCNACGVMLGNQLGANEKEKAMEYAKKFLFLVTAAGIITSIAILLSSSFIANLFNVEPLVKKNIINCLFVFSLYLPFKVLNMLIIVGILRSGGDTFASMIIDLVGVWLIGIPMAIFGGLYLKLDIHFVYAMILIEEVFKLILCLFRYYTKKWVKNIVIDRPS